MEKRTTIQIEHKTLQKLRTGLEFDYYRSKLWKDVYDVASLSGLEIKDTSIERIKKILTGK